MAYTRPMVMVFQEYESTSVSTPSAELPPCIIGPCYHIVDPVEDETLALAGTYTEAGMDSAFFPNNAPGALIENDSVSFRFKNAMVQLGKGLALDPDNESSKNALVLEDKTYLNLVEIGDYVTFLDVENPDEPKVSPLTLRVIGKNENDKSILLNRNCILTEDQVNTQVNIERKIEEFEIGGDSQYVLLDLSSERFTITGVKYAIDGVEYSVSAAELYVGYKALRQDLSDIKTIYSVDEIKGKLGKITPENPLAFGVSIAMANASIGIKAIGVDSDDLAGYTAAKDRLENHDPVYAMVPLTFDPAVLSMFKMHAEEFSQPDKCRWRMAIGCTKLVTEKEIARSKGKLSKDGDGDFVVLTTEDPEVAFLSDSVDAGDTLTLKSISGEEFVYTIASVAADDTLTVTQSKPFDAVNFAEDVEYEFAITHKLDRLDQAKEIRDVSKSYGYCRYVNIFPDICVVDEKELPGYYMGCALAAGIGGLPSHYGMTRLSLAGISGVKHGTDYFNNDQLDTIADGGTLLFVQANESAPPHIRHQLTTDRSTLEFQELSFVKNFDYISYICRDAMDVYLGKYNITQSTLQTLHTALAATLESLKLYSVPKIGSPVLNYNIVKVEQMENIRDRVEMYAEISMPYPLNTIGLHLKSVFMQITSSGN